MTDSDPIGIDFGRKGYFAAMALSLDMHIASSFSSTPRGLA
jgi:hypothetical protein